MDEELKRKINNWLYYIIAGAISLVVLVIFPMLQSSADTGFDIPDNFKDWFIYITEKVAITALNLMI